MKKLLLSTLVLFVTSLCVNAQVLQSDNFDSYNVGNVGTLTDGAEAGQGGWFTFIAATGSDNTSNNNFQFVDGDPSDKDFRLTGSATAAGTRFMWQDGLVTAWAERTVGNEIIEVEFDYFTGSTTASNNEFRVYIYSDETPAKVLAGIGIAKNLVVSGVNFSNVVRGFLHWTSTPGTGTYSIGLGESATAPLTLPQDTWVRLGFSFNKTTAEVIWKSSLGLNGSFTGNAQFPMVTAGINPGEVDFLGIAGTGNTTSSFADFDNFQVRATLTDDLLSSENEFATANFSIYPNPASDVINLNAGNLIINSVKITDINGRVVSTFNVNLTSSVEINVSDLTTGIYFLTVDTDQGVGTSKIVKK
jgi:hypothetical protein